MPHRAFALFVLPSFLAMLLFIALPLVSVAAQSLHVEHPQVIVGVEACDPFGCRTEVRVDTAARAEPDATEPPGRFNGLGTDLDAAHLAVADLREAWGSAPSWRAALAESLDLPFRRALLFTQAYTAGVSPLALGLGLALAVDVLPGAARGG